MPTYLLACELSSIPGYDTLLAPVARQLQEAGCGVVVAARDVAVARQEFGEPFDIVAAPAKMRQASVVSPVCFAELLQLVGFAASEELLGMAAAWREIMARCQADVVVVEHSPTALLAARCCGCPAVVLGDAFCNPPPLAPLPPFVSQQSTPAIEQRCRAAERRVTATANEVLDHFSARRLATLSSLYHDVALNLLNSYPELLPYPEEAVRDNRLVGHWAVKSQPPTDDKSIPRSRNAVLARLQPVPNLEVVVRWLAALEVDVYLVDETREIEWGWPTLAGRFRFIRPDESLAVLPHCQMAVLSAGHHAVAACLGEGTPVVMIPRATDQVLLAQRVMELGAGLAPPLHEPREIVADLERVRRDPYFREQAELFSQRHGAGMKQANLERAMQSILAVSG